MILLEAKKAAGKAVKVFTDHKILIMHHGLQTVECDKVEVGVDAAEFEHQQHPEHVAGVLLGVAARGNFFDQPIEAGVDHRCRRVDSGEAHVGPAPHHLYQRQILVQPHLRRRLHKDDEYRHGRVVVAGRLDGAHLTRARLCPSWRHQKEHQLHNKLSGRKNILFSALKVNRLEITMRADQ